MKIYLAYPWKFPDSPYYKYLINFPPKNVNYITAQPEARGATHSMTKLWTINFIKRNLNRIRRNVFPLPNLVNVKGNYDLVHCARCLNLSEIPYVLDLEDYWSLGGVNSRFSWGKTLIEKELKKEKCKKVMPWTNTAKKRFLMEFKSEEIAKKTETVYPAVPCPKKTKKSEKITIMFVSRYFWIKGGLVVLETLKQLKEKYDVGVVVVSEVPNKLKDKYPMITFPGLLPYEKVKEIYKQSHILLYPSFVDTFGFCQLEAMSYGLPVVTVNGFARTEIINNEKTGFIVDRPEKVNFYKIGKPEEKIVKELFEKTALLIENKSLRKKMSNDARKEIKEGKFSIDRRNKRLRDIYVGL